MVAIQVTFQSGAVYTEGPYHYSAALTLIADLWREDEYGMVARVRLVPANAAQAEGRAA